VIELRGYDARDLDAMFRLDEECFEEPFRFTRSAMRQFAESRKARVVIAESVGALAGFAILHAEGRVGYIVTLDVAAEDAACAVVGLHVFVGNEAAIRFYERVGYERVGDVPAFYGDGLDAWVYRKKLEQT